MPTRLQKVLANAGIASRRKAEEIIAHGHVKVNGQIVKEMGVTVEEGVDKIEVDNRPIKASQRKIYIALNKPEGYICSASSEQGPSVLELVPLRERIYPIGRLDKDSCGLVILTNDGEFANKLTHPKFEKEKEYRVILSRPLERKDTEKLAQGMELDGEKLLPIHLASYRGKLVNLILHEGVNRQIRRQMGQLGYGVMRLERVRIGHLKIGNIREGKWRFINKSEI
ncbi:MAG: pseudouridine synthase [bacterium]